MRGIFYTIAVVLLLAPLLGLVYYYAVNAAQEASAAADSSSVMPAGKLVESLESDFDRALLISSKSAVLSATERVVGAGVPLADSDSALRSLLVNGTFPGENTTYQSSTYNNIGRWASQMEALARFYGYSISLGVSTENVSVQMENSYTLLFKANLTVRASPLRRLGTFNITRTSEYSARVPLEDYEDPLYAANTQGLVPRSFSFNTTQVWGVAALDSAIASHVYLASAYGPDFLTRLEGSFAASPQGLETLVDPNELLAQDLSLYNRSMVDYKYFNASAAEGNAWTVNGSTHSLFILDCVTAARFGVNDSIPECA